MSARDFSTEWADRSERIFQETAEALGTTTNLIIAATERSIDGARFVIAMFTPDYEAGSRDMVSVVLERDGDGILHERKRDVLKDGLDQMEAYVEGRLTEKFGEPE